MSENISYGGQAVIEGVMMRGRHFVACAVRDPKGNIISMSEPIAPFIYSSRWMKLPLLRAVPLLWDTLVLGTKMLMYSANIAVEEESPKGDAAKAETPKSEAAKTDAPVTESGTAASSDAKKEMPAAIPTVVALGTLAVSLSFGVGLFFVLPLFLVSLIDPYLKLSLVDGNVSALASNIVEGCIRLALFLLYIGAIGLMPDVRRVFQYHGAEHKTIAADEAGVTLSPETIQKYNKEHPRCGTGFLLVVVVVSIFVFALFGQPPMVWRVLLRIVLIPFVAALSYELIKFSSAHKSNPVLNWLVVQPSLKLQSLTTREPDDAMVEVAVAALQRVKAEEAR